MIIRENVLLSSLTTLKVGGAARYVALCESIEDVKEAVALAKREGLSFYVLGEGSNVLAHDDGYNGVILLVRILGTEVQEENNAVRLTAGAGVSWDDVVRRAAEHGAWGIENLAGIPGTMGAAPVQNIGAYGADLSQVLESVEVYDTTTDEVRILTVTECELGYRDSRFKHDQSLIILRVTLLLRKDGTSRLDYSDLKKAYEAGEDLSTPEKIGETVRAIRARKFPDMREHGTAGSFFKNPVLTEEAYARLVATYGEAPRFPHPAGVKVPLAFILDKALSLRGFRLGKTWLFGAQPLVLVADNGAEAKDIDALAHEVEARVRETTDISIEREVRTMPRS